MPLSVPHILLLVTDQLRFDVVTPDITPNLYRLAQHSTVFRNAYTSTPSCTPARAGLLTGKSPWAHGMLSYTDFTNCTNYPTTLPKVLTEYFNYTTACVGKNHFGPNTTQGYQDVLLYDGLSFYQDDYDEWFRKTAGDDMDPLATCGLEWNDWKACPYVYEEYFHPTAWTTRTAIEYFQNYTSNDSLSSPLFLKVSYHRPHSPYDPPRRIFKQYLEGGPKSHLPQLDRFLNNTSWDRQYRGKYRNSLFRTSLGYKFGLLPMQYPQYLSRSTIYRYPNDPFSIGWRSRSRGSSTYSRGVPCQY